MRYSFTLTSTSEIPTIAENIEKNSISQVYLTNTQPEFHALEKAILLKKLLPRLDIVITVSTKYFTSLDQIESIISKGKLYQLDRYLIVSGYPKTDLDSIVVIQNLRSETNLFCVYNPYDTYQQIENQRLKQKLKNPQVKGVFLQIGIDPEKLEQGITFIKRQNPELIIEGCVLMPTAEVRERLQKKPIHGINLNDEYLHNQLYAIETTNRIREIYKKYLINEIIEDFSKK